MSKTATQIITRALTLLDEILTDFDTAATTEMSLSDVASDILPEVCRNLVKELPYELKRYLATSDTLLAEVLAGGELQTSYTKQKVAYTAPSDFWELVAIRLSVWSNPVTKYILVDSPLYSIQNNPFTRGGKQNPVVAISNAGTGAGARIECFSIHSGDTATVSTFQYVSFNNVPDDAGNSWPDELFEITSKALASELAVIKNNLQEGSVVGSEGGKILEQHK